MPETGGDGANEPPRTLAEKLSRLREARAPEGGRPPSWDALAKQISDKTGIAVSGAYLWELGTGKPGTNVTLKHLKAFKEFFGRRISYFVDDEVAFEDDEQAQLALLKELRRLGIKQIRLQNMENDVSQATVTDLLGRLQTLDILRNTDIRDIALQVTDLTAKQRETLSSLIGKPSLLDALPRTVGLLEAATDLNDEQLASTTRALDQPDVLQALQDTGVCEIARRCRELLPSSREAVLSMIAQLGRLERGKA
ncbi:MULTISPECIES: hypothetical protein [unclassified Streptomyces]|uniref:hypothetical protein n=1 Tax=unclassified Streptomyces TaxID=2593676 RepID=UPI00087D5CD5|nr:MULTISPECIES: hypothetical protein [unclassified Streptomyces]REH20586.1 hypothetical protein BX268_2368 [Streptomyces sp. 2221.1]SDT29341.1 hypothetical protein SAMN05428941_2363 [Streptomyces sp. 2114.2]